MGLIRPGRPKILMMTDCPLIHTGQAVVIREISLGLHALGKYDIVVAAWGYGGQPHQLPYTMLPASARDFGRNGIPEAGIPPFERIIDQVRPDIVWTVADIWMVDYITQMQNRNSFKWIAYTPIDGDPVPDNWVQWFRNADQLVCETKYGMDAVAGKCPDVDPTFIYHGCKPQAYRPLSDAEKKNIRQNINYQGIKADGSLENRRGLPEDAFVVGCFARNQPRKNFDKTLKAFKRFAKDKPNARLWIHAAPIDQAYNLPQIAKMWGIADKVCFTPNYNILRGLDENNLNMVMNTFDVHLLPTQGEGFGIPILETMAAGVPQIVSDYTSQVEFAREGGELIPLYEDDDFITGMPHPVERAIPRPSEMERLLNKLYSDPAHRLDLAKKARAKAETMSWAATIPQWEQVIDRTLARPPKSERLAVEILSV
jgi:glycosyltransferase involved in cell wall biosynthesis